MVECWLLLVLVRGRYRDRAWNGSFRAIDTVAGLDLPADPAAFGNSQVIVILKIQPKLRGQAKYFPKRTAVSALMARSPRTTS